MRRDVAEPVDAGGFEGDVGVEAAGDGAVDDGLPLLLQQRDELLLGGDVAADTGRPRGLGSARWRAARRAVGEGVLDLANSEYLKSVDRSRIPLARAKIH